MVTVLQRIQEGTLDRPAFAGPFASIDTNSFGSLEPRYPESKFWCTQDKFTKV